MRLLAPPSVTHDGFVTAHRAPSRQQAQRDRRHVGIGLALSLRQCDKKNHGWREGLPLTAPCQVFDLVTGLHPPGKSVPNEKSILLSDDSRGSLYGLAGIKGLPARLVHGEFGDEIDNCGFFRNNAAATSSAAASSLHSNRSTRESFLPKFSFLISRDTQTESAHQSINLEVLDAAVQYIFPPGLVKSTTGYKAQKLSLQGIEASSTCSMQIFLPWAVSKSFTGAILSVRRVEYDIEREIKALGQSGLPRADWIAKPFRPPRPRCHNLLP